MEKAIVIRSYNLATQLMIANIKHVNRIYTLFSAIENLNKVRSFYTKKYKSELKLVQLTPEYCM